MLSTIKNAVAKTVEMNVGSRTVKLIVTYLYLSTCITIFAIYKCPEQLSNVALVLGAIGGGGASFKWANSRESAASKNGQGDPTS